jgi:hypothetical protein
MTASVPRIFWLSVSIALLAIAASVSYFLVVALPVAQRHRSEVSAQLAAAQVRDKQVIECAEQARRTADDMGKHSSGFGPPPAITGSTNHYNRKLGKCIVDVQTMEKNTTVEYVLDAYEQSSILWCMTQFTPKASQSMQRTCLDAQNKRIDPAEADKQIDGLLRE